MSTRNITIFFISNILVLNISCGDRATKPEENSSVEQEEISVEITIQGNISDGLNGSPLTGAQLVLKSWDGNNTVTIENQIITDEQGYYFYSFEYIDCTSDRCFVSFRLNVNAQGYGSDDRVFTYSTDNFPSDMERRFNIDLYPLKSNIAFQIQGMVTDTESGLPIDTASVELFDFEFSADSSLRKALTDSLGAYSLNYFFDGECSGPTGLIIRASSEGYSFSAPKEIICTEEIQTFDFQLRKD